MSKLSAHPLTLATSPALTGEVTSLLMAIAGEMARQKIQVNLGLKHAEHFRKAYLLPALAAKVSRRQPKFRALMERVVEILQETLSSIDFWHSPDKQQRERGLIKTEPSKAGIDALKGNRERVAVEAMKLAKKRDTELVQTARGTER